MLSELPEESRVINTTNTYRNIDFDVDSNHISFLLNGYRYDIHQVGKDESFTKMANKIAKSIVDNFYLD